MKKSLQIKVIGKVQGVFFRASTQREARALHLCGFVRNEPDGSVYIEVEGEAKSIDSFIDWCKTGPPLSSVQQIDISENTEQGFKDFTIQRFL